MSTEQPFNRLLRSGEAFPATKLRVLGEVSAVASIAAHPDFRCFEAILRMAVGRRDYIRCGPHSALLFVPNFRAKKPRIHSGSPFTDRCGARTKDLAFRAVLATRPGDLFRMPATPSGEAQPLVHLGIPAQQLPERPESYYGSS